MDSLYIPVMVYLYFIQECFLLEVIVRQMELKQFKKQLKIF